MLNLMKSTKTEQPVIPHNPTIADKLTDTRLAIIEASDELAKLHAQQNKYMQEATLHLAKHGDVARAKTALENLYSQRTSGELVSASDVALAEELVINTMKLAQHAESEANGARLAANKLDTQIGQLEAQISGLNFQVNELLGQNLVETSAESLTTFNEAIDVFSKAFVKHHATITAINSLAKQLGHNAIEPFPSPTARFLTIAGGGNAHGISHERQIDLGQQINKEAEIIFNALQAL